MRYKPRNVAALRLALGGLPDKMQVHVESDIAVFVKTVGELRKIAAWPENLAITTPRDHHPESSVTVSKATTATRTSRKA
jgi:hypothetical protein